MTMLTTRPCRGLAGFLFGHDFKPRFSTHKVDNWRPTWDAPFVTVTGLKAELKPNVEDRKYKGDVCTRCGAVVNEPVIPT